MSVKRMNSGKESALISAILNDDIKRVKELIKTKSATGGRDSNGMTALMYAAAAERDEKIILALLPLEGKMTTTKAGKCEVGGKRYTFEKGSTALMFAVRSHHPETLRSLVEWENGMSDEKGQTALIIALQSGNTEAARMLVKYEAGMQQKNGWSALMEAALYNQVSIVKLLEGAEKGLKTNQRVASSSNYTVVFPTNATALYIAEHQNHKEVSDILRKYDSEIPVFNEDSEDQDDSYDFDIESYSVSEHQDSEQNALNEHGPDTQNQEDGLHYHGFDIGDYMDDEDIDAMLMAMVDNDL